MGTTCSKHAENGVDKNDRQRKLTEQSSGVSSRRDELHKILDTILDEQPDIDSQSLLEKLSERIEKNVTQTPEMPSSAPKAKGGQKGVEGQQEDGDSDDDSDEEEIQAPPLLQEASSIENGELVDSIKVSRIQNPDALNRRSVAFQDAVRSSQRLTVREYSSRKIRDSLLGASDLTGTASASFDGGKNSKLRLSLSVEESKARARQILFEKVTHENDGFLSPENGFMPSEAPLRAFKTINSDLKKWDALVEEMRDKLLLFPSKFRARVDAMPVFPSDVVADTELLRASSVLGTVLQTYWYCGSERKQPRQDLLNAWGEVRRRLNWHVEDAEGKKYYDLPFYTLLDYSTYNWRQTKVSGHYHVDDLQLDQLELNVLGMPPVDNSERFFYISMLLIMARGALLPLLCVEAQEAAARQDDGALAHALIHICQIWECITNVFAQVNPHHGASQDLRQTDAIVFSRLFADTAIPMPCTKVAPSGEKIVTPSTGQSVPVFQLMDCFFNRKKFTGVHGADVGRHIAAYPRRWRNFIRAIQEPDDVYTTHIDMYIRRSRNPELQGLFAHALQTFAGDNGFLGRHLIKLYGYMAMLFRTGREATMGGYSGHPLDRTEDKIRSALWESQRDRFAERPGRNLRHTARLNEKAVPLGSGDRSMWSVCLNLEGEGMRCSLGDHLRVLPKNMRDVGDKFCELVLSQLGLSPDAEVQVADLPAWQEQLNYFLGEKAPKIPRVGDIALYGQIRKFLSPEADITRTQLQEIVPLTARLYSISVVQTDRSGHVRYLYLTVREWKDGVASRLLVRGKPGTEVIVQVYQSHVLRRLDEGPVLYFASGTGISPFTNLYSDNGYPFAQWLIWMTKTLSDDMNSDFKFVTRYNQHLKIDVLQTGKKMTNSLSKPRGLSKDRSSQRVASSHNFVTHNLYAGRGQRLAAFLSKGSSEFKKLCKLVRHPSLTILACGNIGFVMEVINLLRDIDVNIERWIALGRLRVECFGSPGWIPSGASRLYTPWEILRSSLSVNLQDGIKETSSPPLMIVSDNVYEVTQNMVDIHPGGKDLILMYQGADATQPFLVVGHDKDGNATGMLQAFEVGRFDRDLFASFSDEKCDLLRLAWDCAETRNCHMIDDSLHERMTLKPYYCSTDTEIHATCAMATHQRVVRVHFPHISRLVQSACDRFCPNVNFDELMSGKIKESQPPIVEEASLTASSPNTNECNWQDQRTKDRKFFESCVSHAANLCEDVMNEEGKGVSDILLAWKTDLKQFQQMTALNVVDGAVTNEAQSETPAV